LSSLTAAPLAWTAVMLLGRAAMGRWWLVGLTCLWPAWGQIRVMAPESLVNRFSESQGRIDGSTATFGAPFYGQRLLGRLVWGESRTNHTHCKESDYTVPEPDQNAVLHHEHNEVRLIHIIIVRRGKCSFVTKVRVAQAKGAHAVVIVDKEDSAMTAKDIRRIIVADDGYGNTVDIPSMLVSKQEGQYLIDAARTSDQVIVELAWDVPTDHVVLVDMWMSSASRESLHFLKEWTAKRKALNEAIKFVPHYHVFGMQATTDYNDLCTDVSAKFCAEDPDGSGPVTGSMVLDEDVRQLCIHEQYKVKRLDPVRIGNSGTQVEYSREYWDYVERLLDVCPLDGRDAEARFGKVCSEKVMKQVGIDVEKIQHCVDNTREIKLREQRENTAWSPRALRINGWRYTGALDADLVTRAICAGFVTQPKACEELVKAVHPVLKALQPPSSGVSLSSFVTALLVVTGLALAALVLYKRSLTRHIHSALREEVMLEVQAQMDSYKQMS